MKQAADLRDTDTNEVRISFALQMMRGSRSKQHRLDDEEVPDKIFMSNSKEEEKTEKKQDVQEAAKAPVRPRTPTRSPSTR